MGIGQHPGDINRACRRIVALTTRLGLALLLHGQPGWQRIESLRIINDSIVNESICLAPCGID